MRDARFVRTVEATTVLLFLLQSVRVLFSVLFGIIYDTVFEETFPLAGAGGILVAVIAALLTPLAASRRRGETALWIAALVAALARVPVTFNIPSIRLWASIVVIGTAGFYAAILTRRYPRRFGPALVMALVADQFLRTAGNTFDLALRPWWWPVQVALVAGVGLLGWWALTAARGEEAPATEGLSLGGGLAVGALLFLETSLLNFPNGVARWSQIPYEVVAPLLMAVTLLPLLPPVRHTTARLLRGPLGGLGLLFLALAGLAAGRMIAGAAGLFGLLAAQFLLLLVLLGVTGPRRRDRTGLALALGLLLFLIVNFAMAFAFTYPYTIPAFRGMGLPVVLFAAFIAALPAVRSSGMESEPTKRRTWHWLSAAFIVLLTVAFAWPRPVTWREVGPPRVGTYNIHYGYNTTWQLNIEEIARTIEESRADAVMLQEVDTCRVTSYGVDNAFWLARRLGMQAVYYPTLEELSGLAIISRFPVIVADGALLDSELEQTAIVHARLRVEDQEVEAYCIWLGLSPDERARQLTDALAFIGDTPRAVLGGDFNSTPESPVYARLEEAGFTDPFVALGLDPAPTAPAIEPRSRIDFVWGRGLAPIDAEVPDSPASDHLLVITEWRLP